MSSKKVLVGLLVLALAAGFLTAIKPVAASPTKWYVQILYDDNEYLANKKVAFTIWNVTGNTAVLYVVGTTDEYGRLWWDEDDWCNATPVQFGSYNYTLFIYEYDKWFLLNWSVDITHQFPCPGVDWATYIDPMINGTIYAGHYWGLYFQALTTYVDLADQSDPENFFIPLYLKKKLAEDIAQFKVYLVDHAEVPMAWETKGNKSAYVPIWEALGNEEAISVREENGRYTDIIKYLNISDTRIEPDPANCFYVKDFWNTSLVKEVYWLIGYSHQNLTLAVPVQVGEDVLNFEYYYDSGGVSRVDLSVTSNVWPHPSITYWLATWPSHISANKYGPVKDFAFTKFKAVVVRDCKGDEMTFGSTPAKVFFQFKLDGRDTVVREGQVNATGWAPYEGASDPREGIPIYYRVSYDGVTAWFWLPDISRPELYSQNYTMNVNYLGITVYSTDDINSTIIPQFEIEHVDASIVPVAIEVEDKEPSPQPLPNAKVVIEIPGADPITTTTAIWFDGRAYVVLPPYWRLPLRLPGAGDFAVYWYSAPMGYLPIPFNMSKFDYRIRIYWKPVWNIYYEEAEWIDVTWEENSTITIEGCPPLEVPYWKFTVLAEVYQAKIRIVDLCYRPLTIDDIRPEYYSSTALRLYWVRNGELVYVGDTSVDYGTIVLDKIPEGTYAVKLVWKGVELSPWEEVNATNTFTVPENVVRAITFVFPIGDLNITLTQWDDCDQVLAGLNATIEYYNEELNVLKYVEEWERSDCDGVVSFEKVPFVIPDGFNLTLKVYTWDTPYTRIPKDNNLLVWTGKIPTGIFEEFADCTVTWTRPVWIYSFELWAVDHAYEVLEDFETDVGTYHVVAALRDTTYQKEMAECPYVCCPEVLVDYRIINITNIANVDPIHGTNSPEAKFVYTSRQYDKNHPHLYVAGATYNWMVFHGGVLVYNYTIALPRPDQRVAYIFNETSRTYDVVSLAPEEEPPYDWSWWDKDDGMHKTHPILIIEPAPDCIEEPAPPKPVIKLVTWTQTLEVYTLSNAGEYMAPSLNLTLIRNDVLNATFLHDASNYNEIVGEAWYCKATNYAWNSVDGDGDGVIVIQVPVWQPRAVEYVQVAIKFGSRIKNAFILAGSEWSTPGVPDTPHAGDIGYSNCLKKKILHGIYGYVVNWNHTAHKVVNVTCHKFFPTWWKNCTEFRGNNTWYAGDCWNMTYWSGAAKVVRTLMMDGFCVEVRGYDIFNCEIPMPNQLISVVAIGDTGETLTIIDWGEAWTNETGIFESRPEKVGETLLPDCTTAKPIAGGVITWKFNVTGIVDEGLPEIDYTIKAREDYTKKPLFDEIYEKILKPAGLEYEDVMSCIVETIETEVKFSEDHNAAKECVVLEWAVIKGVVEDWTGNPLANMTVLIIRRGDAMPSAFGITDEHGRVVVYVASDTIDREIKIYWRDTYFLEYAGIIPRALDIYDSLADEIVPRWARPWDSATIKTRVYGVLFKVTDAEGEKLTKEAYDKITVRVTWPDKVVTEHKPDEQGIVKLVMSKDTIITMTGLLSPESPPAVPQAPEGEYVVEVEWEGVGIIARHTFKVEAGKTEAGAPGTIVQSLSTEVYDMTVFVKTPFDTPMAGASVKLANPGFPAPIETTVASDGSVAVEDVPLGTLEVTVESWRGLPIDFKKTATVAEPVVIVEKIGMLKVRVVGARGQGLGGAEVVVTRAGETVWSGTTAPDGTASVELPEGSYSVKASYGGKESEASATITGAEVTEAKIELPVFLEVAGWAMTLSDFVGLLLLIVLLVIVIVILLHEYAVWRRKRLAKVLVPTKPGA